MRSGAWIVLLVAVAALAVFATVSAFERAELETNRFVDARMMHGKGGSGDDDDDGGGGSDPGAPGGPEVLIGAWTCGLGPVGDRFVSAGFTATSGITPAQSYGPTGGPLGGLSISKGGVEGLCDELAVTAKMLVESLGCTAEEVVETPSLGQTNFAFICQGSRGEVINVIGELGRATLAL